MLVYEKLVAGVRHLFGTLGNLPADNDVQLTYKDSSGTILPLVEKDTYRDDKKGGIVRDSDKKAVNVFIGDTCIIGKVDPVATAKVSAPVQKVETKVETKSEVKVEEKVEDKVEVKSSAKQTVKEEKVEK